MASIFNVAVLFEALDKLTGPVGKMADSLRGFQGEVKKTATAAEKLKTLGKGLAITGAGISGAGALAAGAFGLETVPAQAMRAQHSMAALANMANLSAARVREINAEVLALTKTTNQDQESLIGGLQALLSRGMDERKAMTVLGAIGKTATAAQASVEDLARTVFAGVDGLEIPAEKATAYLDALAQAGKDGSFELRDMARHFPALTAKANALGMAGIQGASQLAAALQVAMKGAGSPDEAANNLNNFLTKLTAPETVRNFQKFGVDLKREIKAGFESGDLPGYMADLIQRTTKGDQFKLGEMFGDMQVLAFLKPFNANLREYREIQAKAQNAKGVVDGDHAKMMGTFVEQWKKLRINMTTLVLPMISPWLQRINGWMERLNGSSKGIKLLVGGIMSALVGGAALSVLGGGLSLLGHGLPLILRTGGALKGLGLGAVDAVRYIKYAQGQTGSLVSGVASYGRLLLGGFNFGRFALLLKGVGVAIAGVSAPVWIAVGVIAAAGLLIWKFWRPIAGFFKGIWQGLKEGLAPLKPAFAALGQAMAPILAPLKSAWEWLKRILTPAGESVRTFEWGRKVGHGLAWAIRGVVKVLSFLAKSFLFNIGVARAFLSTGWELLKWWANLPSEFMRKVQEFRKAGASIPKAIWEGIKSMGSKPVEAMRDMVGRIRRLLPFSPAKDGPLRDIHKIRLVETIAGVIRPEPMVAAMRNSLRALRSSIALPSAAALVAGGAGGGRAGIVLEFRPVIHIQGGSAPDVEAAVRKALKEQADEMLRQLQRAQERQNRRAF